jgi:hypothetical protein
MAIDFDARATFADAAGSNSASGKVSGIGLSDCEAVGGLLGSFIT